MPIPENLSFEEATAIPEVFLTAYQTLFWLGNLHKDKIVLIHAGGGGVGTAAIQLVREIGAKSIVTAGSEEKLKFCRTLGAEVTINYREGPFSPKVLTATENRGVDIILDFVGGPYWEENLKCLNEEGRLILIGTLGGRTVENVDLNLIMRKKIEIIGTTLRGRSQEYKIQLTEEFSEFALPLFQDGSLKPILHKILPWEDVKVAHRIMEENKNIGKIVLNIP